MLAYRTSPHPATGQPPSQLIFKHQVNNGLPQSSNIIEQPKPATTKYQQDMKNRTDKARNAKPKDFNTGSKVLIKNYHHNNKTTPYYEQTPYTVVENHPFSVIVQRADGQTFKRNKSHLKLYNTPLNSNPQTSRSYILPSQETQTTEIWPQHVQLVPDEQADAEPPGEESSSSDDDTIPYDISEGEEIETGRPKRTISKPLRYRE